MFLIFIGCLQFGFGKPYGLACGILSIADGIVLQLAYCKNPNYFAKPDDPALPTARQEDV